MLNTIRNLQSDNGVWNMHVKSGDEVLVITGKDKGKRGKIKEAQPKDRRVVVEGLNIIKRHTKQRGPAASLSARRRSTHRMSC